jgi:tungstate transport system permease protein
MGARYLSRRRVNAKAIYWRIDEALSGMWQYWGELADGLADAIVLLVSGDTETWTIIRQSLLISVSAALGGMFIGAPLGFWLYHASFRGRSVVLALCNTGFGLPPVVVGLILSLLLLRHGPLGALNLRFTPGAMIVGQFILSLPIAINLTFVALQQLNPKLSMQMRALGASRWQMFWLLSREIRLPLLVAYMACFGAVVSEVGASQMLGGNLPGSTRVLTTAIVMETGMGHYDRAIAYGLVLLVLVAMVVGLLTWLQQKSEHR